MVNKAKILASVKEKEHAIRLANQVVVEQLSVRELEKIAKKKPLLSKSPKEEGLGNERRGQGLMNTDRNSKKGPVFILISKAELEIRVRFR